MKKLLSILALFVVSLLAVSLVSADNLSNLEIKQLKINGDVVEVGEKFDVDEGDTLKIKVKLENKGTTSISDIEVEAEIRGYEYDQLEDSTTLFDLDAGANSWTDELSIKLPKKLDNDVYSLRVTVTDKNSKEVSKTYILNVNPTRHGLDVKDVVFSPGTSVKAGRSLLATVLIDNFGGKQEEDVKVTLEVPDLGLSVSEYVDKIDADDRKTSEELFLKLPQCVKEGDYAAEVSLEYDEGKTVSKNFQLHVLEEEKCAAPADKLILTVGPESQNIVVDQKAVYPIALTNAGSSAKTYALELVGGDWAASSLSENLVVLEPGKTKVVYAYLTANEKATSGEKVATLSVKSDNNVLKTIYLKANVVEQKAGSLRNYVEIALIVLVVVLVIIGLIIGFSRLKKNEDQEEDKTYY